MLIARLTSCLPSTRAGLSFVVSLALSLLEHTMLIELEYPTPNAVELKAAHTLLLIIDMENENAHPSGALYIGEPVRKIISKIAELRARLR